MLPKTPCEVCGKMLTTAVGPRANHMRQHRSEGIDPAQVAQQSQQPEAAAAEPQEEAQAVPVNATKAADEVVQRRMELALKAQERFLKGPKIVLEDNLDPRMALRQRYAPDTIDKVEVRANRTVVTTVPRRFDAFFGDPGMENLYASRAYLPVLDENGDQVTHEGQLFYKRDRRIGDAERGKTQEESRRRLSPVGAVRDQAESGGDPELMGDTRAVRIEEQSVYKGKIEQE